MATCQTGISAEGFESIRLANSHLSVSVLPEIGGKICQLRNLVTGRDWLWRNPHIPLRHPAPGLDYDQDLDSGGWDEVLFSVKPCRISMPNDQHLLIGDHGNAVDRAWRVIEAGVDDAGEAVCALETTGRTPDFKLHRKIALHATQPSFEITYRLFNTGQQSWPWLWCAHPLLAVEHGMRIDLCAGQEMRLLKDGLTTGSTDLKWPNLDDELGDRVNLERIFTRSEYPQGFCRKVYVRSTGKALLHTVNDEERLEFTYDTETLPWLGLWINKQGWSGAGTEPYLNLGLEPATAPHDSLSDAIDAGEAEVLKPGQSRTWSLAVAVNNSEKA